MRRQRINKLKRRVSLGATAAVESLEQRLCLTVSLGAASDYNACGLTDFVTSGDFNRDGNRDVVASSYDSSNLSILLGNGDGTFQAPVTIPLASTPDFVTSADVNNDGKIDLITASFDNNVVSVLLGNGDGTFQTAVDYAAGTGPRAVVLGDFTGDGKLDIAVAKSFDQNLSLLVNNGDGTFKAPVNCPLNFTPSDLVATDINHDNKLDLVACDYFGNKVDVMLGNGNGTFQTAIPASTGQGPTSIAACDLSGDGKIDIVTANYLDGTVSVLLGNGNGTLQTATMLTAGSGATFVGITNLDAGGHPDLLVLNANDDTIMAFPGNGDGTFQSPLTISAGNMPRSLTIGDFNNDTMCDVAMADQGSSSVTVLLNAPLAHAGGPYSAYENGTVQLDASSSTGNGLTYEWDFDGDGIFGETGSAATRGDEVGPKPTFLAAGLDGPTTTTVDLLVTDANGLTSTDTATINILNVTPTLAISGGKSGAENSPYTLYLDATTTGYDTISHWFINWGNGTSQTVNGDPSSVTKTYTALGTYTITATATDEAGTYSANIKNVTVTYPIPKDTAGNTIQTARNLGALKMNAHYVTPEGVNTVDRDDYYKFSVATRFTLNASLYKLLDNADLYLLNSKGTVLFPSKHTGKTAETITQALNAGTYFLRVNYPGKTGTTYSLSIQATLPPEMLAAKSLGVLKAGSVPSVSGTLSPKARTNYFRFQLATPLQENLNLLQLKDNADLEVLNAAGTIVKASTHTGTTAEALSLNLAKGTYYIEVWLAGTKGTSYRLSLASK